MRHDGVVYAHCLYMFKTSIHLDYLNFAKSLVEAFGAHSFKNLSQGVKKIDFVLFRYTYCIYCQ
jgi:hypothetical protein